MYDWVSLSSRQQATPRAARDHPCDSKAVKSYIPSEKLLIAILDGASPKDFNVTFGSPSLIIRCTIMSALNTIVHVESRNLCCRVLNTSATPASPAWVATSMCSTYLDLGAASYTNGQKGTVKLEHAYFNLCSTLH